MYKENTKYKIIGYQPVGIEYTIPREEIVEWKNGYWCPWGSNKKIKNFVIQHVIEMQIKRKK